jgi:hypothetical protein
MWRRRANCGNTPERREAGRCSGFWRSRTPLRGMSRAEAARAAGIERQSLRDAVVRFNAEGLAGLVDRPRKGRPERLTEGEQAALVGRILRGPDPDSSTASSERDRLSGRSLCRNPSRFVENNHDSAADTRRTRSGACASGRPRTRYTLSPTRMTHPHERHAGPVRSAHIRAFWF